MDFLIYDIVLLIVFAVGIGIFLYAKRKNLKNEGLLFLYKTSWGIRLINYVGGKYKRSLKFLSYVSVAVGYVLMAAMVYLFGKIIWIYVAMPQIVKAIRVPPIMPLIPYIDKVVPGIPEFYFVYWIIIIAIIAIPHEFFHGIFMKRYGIKIKSTGFGFFPFFLPIFLAAFVEQDEKSMESKRKFEQMAVLGAGTFANVLTAVLFFAILILFFLFAFSPAGVVFDDYVFSAVPIASVTMVNGVSLDNPSYEDVAQLVNSEGVTKVEAGGKDFFSIRGFSEDLDYVYLYEDYPAIEAGLSGAITKIDGTDVKNVEGLFAEISKYSPGDGIAIATYDGENYSSTEIVLDKNPGNESLPWLGVGFYNAEPTGITGKFYSAVSFFKEPNIYYEPNFGASYFVYNLLWWIVLISVSVALINMLPMGIFDGGRFFYLTVLGVTKSERIAKRAFRGITSLILLLLLVLMVVWAVNVF